MLLDAARDLGLDLGASAIVGDKPSDLDAGRAAGVSVQIQIGPEGWASIATRLG